MRADALPMAVALLVPGLPGVGAAGCTGPIGDGGTLAVRAARPASLSPAHYEIALSPGLERLTETVCSEGPWTDRVVSIHAEARARLISAVVVSPEGDERSIDVGTRGPLVMHTGGLRADECVRVVFDLASSGGGMAGCLRSPGLVMCATSAWALAAEPWRTGARHRVRLTLPEGVTMSPVLGEDEHGLYLDERSFRYVGYAAFGALTHHEVAVPGGCASVVVPSASPLAESPHLVPWVARAGLASAMITGTATSRGASITAIAVPGGAEPVLFGMAGRGARPSVIALVAEHATSHLETDWTLVHELSHLAIPYVPSEDAWLAEGLATYYQEVLRVRAGMQSAERAWRTLDDGFRRGERAGTGASLRLESRGMHASRAYLRVYWAGAAIALLLDVALRARGDSLDARITRVVDRHDTTMTAAQLLDALDREDGVMRAVVARWLDAEAFPDLSEAYTALGLARAEDGTLRLEEDPGLRAAIMNPAGGLASNGPCPPIPRPHDAHFE